LLLQLRISGEKERKKNLKCITNNNVRIIRQVTFSSCCTVIIPAQQKRKRKKVNNDAFLPRNSQEVKLSNEAYTRNRSNNC